VERKEAGAWISGCRSIEIAGKRGKGRLTKTMQECIKNDMKANGLSKEMAVNRSVWSMSISEKMFNPCKHGKKDAK